MNDSADIQVAGSKNYTAGRDILVNPKSLSVLLSEYFNEVDQEINKFLPNRILSPTRNNQDELFSSERMIRSLLRVGLPIEACFILLDILPQYLQEVVAQEEQTTTHHLRIAVIRAIYNIEGEYTMSQRETWGDRYSRRYGVPNHRIRILESSGDYVLFDYRYIEKEILPHMFLRLTGIEGVEPETIATSQDIDQMTFDIFEGVRSLHLYLVPYTCVLQIAEALAMQPPHPWFVAADTKERTIRYDKDRIDHHKRVIQSNKATDLEKWNSVSECITHSCSSILAYYGAYIGATKYAALNSLAGLVDVLLKGDELTIWGDNQIQNLPADLSSCGLTASQFLAILNKAKKQARWHYSEKSLASLTVTAIQIKDITNRVLDTDKEVGSLIETLTEHAASLSETEFRRNCFSLLKFLPDSKIQRVQTNSKLRWLVHSSESNVMREIRSHILIYPCAIAAPLETTEIEKKINYMLKAIETRPINVNSIVFVVGSSSVNNFKNVSQKLKVDGCQVIVRSVRDLCDIIGSDLGPEALEKFALQ